MAAGAPHAERVVGMHFFNPAPVMALLEVIAGVRSGEAALRMARATGRAMGKTVIDANDGPGFLVNRCNRPFGLEALRMLAERIADIETIDRICRMEGGFRMGPFELMDLVGIDTGLEVSRSFYELSFGEPRWRPSPISARYAAAGMHGRKTGRGYYDYGALAGGGRHPEEDPPPPAPQPRAAPGALLGSGEGRLPGGLKAAFGEGVGEAADIDTGMVLGLSHPRGPLEWADAIGLDHVLAVLGALHREYGEERYRPAPSLRQRVAAGRTGRGAGGGFFDYPS